MFSNPFQAKTSCVFYCEICDYGSSKKGNMDNHYLTAKHRSATGSNPKEASFCPEYTCQFCEKTYKDKSGLWRHKKTCQTINEIKLDDNASPDSISNPQLNSTFSPTQPQSEDKEIIKLLIKDNSELKAIMMEVVKSIQPNNTNTNQSHNNNSHNTTNTNNNFNLQIYLNETCKDAVNLTDFVDSLQVKLKDLEETAKIGYSEGVSKIFINGLNELEVNKRPIHCSDAKRETLYIKDKNEWTKDADKSMLTKAIKKVGRKNIQQIFEWQKKYPEYNDPASRQNDKYLKMLCNAMNGSTDDEQEKNMDKIIKTITREVVIEKAN